MQPDSEARAVVPDGRFEVDRIAIGIPARRFKIRATIGYDARVPLLTEFVLRLLRIIGSMMPNRLAGYFGLSQRESDVLLDELLQSGFIEYDRRLVRLSQRGRSLFLASDDRDPRIVVAEEFNANIAFERATMTPVIDPGPSPRSLIRVPIKNRERAANASFAVRESFRKNFAEISRAYLARKRDSERAYVYSVDEVGPRKYFTYELSVPIELSVVDEPTLRVNYDNLDRGRYGSRDELIRFTADHINPILRDARVDWQESAMFLSEFDQGIISARAELAQLEDGAVREFLASSQMDNDRIERTVRFVGTFVSGRGKSFLRERTAPSRFPLADDQLVIWVRPSIPYWGRGSDYEDLFDGLRGLWGDQTDVALLASSADGVRTTDFAKWFRDEPKGARRFTLGAVVRPDVLPGGVEMILSPGRWLAVVAYVQVPRCEALLPVGFFSEEMALVAGAFSALAARILPLTETGGALWAFGDLTLDQSTELIERRLAGPGPMP